MADKDKDSKPTTHTTPPAPQVDTEFRRRAALACFEAYVTRVGGFSDAEMDAVLRNVWKYADAFVRLEHAPPLPPPAPVPSLEEALRNRPKSRPVSPDDEWGVVLANGVRKRGFVSEAEAREFAAGRKGSHIVQITGPRETVSVGAPEEDSDEGEDDGGTPGY